MPDDDAATRAAEHWRNRAGASEADAQQAELIKQTRGREIETDEVSRRQTVRLR